MQLRFPAAVVIYLASYLPLSVILLCQDLKFDSLRERLCLPWGPGVPSGCTLPLEHPGYAITAVVICLGALATTLLALRLVTPKQKIVIKESKHVPADLMNYTLPYVVSFMGLDYQDSGKLLGFVVFFLWIFLISYRSGQIVLNPVLTVFGWRLYDTTYQYEGGRDADSNGAILSRVPLEAGRSYRQAAIQDVLIVKSALEPGDAT